MDFRIFIESEEGNIGYFYHSGCCESWQGLFCIDLILIFRVYILIDGIILTVY